MHISVSETAFIGPGPDTERLCFVVDIPARAKTGTRITIQTVNIRILPCLLRTVHNSELFLFQILKDLNPVIV